MIEETVAEWLETESFGVTGTSIFIVNIFDTDKEGISVVFNRELNSWGCFDAALIQVLIYKYDYVVCHNLVKNIEDALNTRRGAHATSWGTRGTISAEYLGISKFNRHTFSISFEVIYTS
jgi:hypothetical protein